MRPTDQMLARLAAESDRKPSSSMASSRPPRRTAATSPARKSSWSPAPAPAERAQRPDGADEGSAPDQRRLGREDRADRQVDVRSRKASRNGRSNTGRPATTLIDKWQAGLGNRERSRTARPVQADRRPPAHTDGPAGILPEPIIGPVVNFVDAARPLVCALGPQAAAVEDVDTAEGHAAHQSITEQSAEKDRARLARR